MPAVASSAPAVLIAHIADATSTLRVGPAVSCCRITRRSSWPSSLATLEALHPRSIDLGLGRAPGTDHVTARALSAHPRPRPPTVSPMTVVELIKYLLPSDGAPTPHPSRMLEVVICRRCGCSILNIQRAVGGHSRSVFLICVFIRSTRIGRGPRDLSGQLSAFDRAFRASRDGSRSP